MSWAANARSRRAYRIEREVKSRGVLVLANWCGCVFEESRAQLEQAGYQVVKHRPAYAEQGHYGRAS